MMCAAVWQRRHNAFASCVDNVGDRAVVNVMLCLYFSCASLTPHITKGYIDYLVIEPGTPTS